MGNGDSFPCQGKGGGCCGNACYAPGSKCCKPKGPKSGWYPVSKATECRKASVTCRNDQGNNFECANGDQCCGDICVGKNDVCCTNVLGTTSHVEGMVVVAAETLVMHLAASAAIPLGWQKPDGTQSARPPSVPLAGIEQ